MARTSPKQRRRQRVLSDDELRAVCRAAEASPGARYFNAFLVPSAKIDKNVWSPFALSSLTRTLLDRNHFSHEFNFVTDTPQYGMKVSGINNSKRDRWRDRSNRRLHPYRQIPPRPEIN
jgi:hypothetical protein